MENERRQKLLSNLKGKWSWRTDYLDLIWFAIVTMFAYPQRMEWRGLDTVILLYAIFLTISTARIANRRLDAALELLRVKDGAE